MKYWDQDIRIVTSLSVTALVPSGIVFVAPGGWGGRGGAQL